MRIFTLCDYLQSVNNNEIIDDIQCYSQSDNDDEITNNIQCYLLSDNNKITDNIPILLLTGW